MGNRSTTLSFLDKCLDGVKPDDSDIKTLLGETEDLWLDFKSGQLLRDRTAAKSVREHVSAFANSAGGVLIIGVADNPRPRPIDGAVAPGGNSIDEWATSALEPLRSYLIPQPRIFDVATSGRHVLVIATGQSHVMAPVYESGQVCYFLRLGDSSGKFSPVRAPDYLAANLLTGRLARPHLVPRTLECKQVDGGSYADGQVPINVEVIIDNDSMTHADDALIMFVFHGPLAGQNRPASPAVMRYLSFDGTQSSDVVVRSTRSKAIHISPFEPYQITFDLIIPKLDGRQLQGALLINCRSGWPSWYEFTIEEINGNLSIRLGHSAATPVLSFR